MPRAFATTLAVCVLALATAGGAHAAEPRIRRCGVHRRVCRRPGPGGSLLLVSGSDLGDVYTAVFPGGRDGIRDLRGRAGQASTTAVRVRVPWEATSGSFVLGTRGGLVSSSRRLKVAPVPVVSRWKLHRQLRAGPPDEGRQPAAGARAAAGGGPRRGAARHAWPRGRPACTRQQPALRQLPDAGAEPRR